MQIIASLPVVRSSINEAVPLYISVQPILDGRSTTISVAPNMYLNARTNTLTLGANVTAQNFAANSVQVLPTNLPSPLVKSGAIQYDGISAYFDAQERGLIAGSQFYRLNQDYGGSQATTRQSLYGVGCRVSDRTTYAFEGIFSLSKVLGTTSHTVGFGFGGDAAIDKFYANFIGPSTVTGTGGMGAFLTTVNNPLPVASTAAITTAAIIISVYIKGTVSFKNAGTFIPQYILSAAPGGAYSTMAGSYFSIYPVGISFANTSIGTWANG
jgi:hypothetical protein